jgi:uncharacterized protein (TIGR00369 family)
MTVHEDWLKKLKAFPQNNMTLPPPTLGELGLEYLEVIPGMKMKAKVPFQKRFTNPVGLFQGGILGACIDEVFGPLSYMTAQAPTVTLSMNISFLGSFKEEMGHCHIEANVLKKTKNFIFMRADVKSPEGDLIAHAETHVKIL